MGFFQTFWAWLSGQLATYIGTTTAKVASILEPAVVTFATVYVMVWGYLQMTGRIEEPFTTGLKRVANCPLAVTANSRARCSFANRSAFRLW